MEATQQKAFEHVFDRYRKALRVFFERRTACRTEAEDLVQDVFARLVAQRDPAAVRNPEAFVFTVAGNLIRDQYRSQRARSAVFEPTEEADAPDTFDLERATAARQELKLADSSRRAMVDRLSRGPASVKELAGPLSMALPSVLKHLAVLENGEEGFDRLALLLQDDLARH